MLHSPAWELESEYSSLLGLDYQNDFQLGQKMVSDFPKVKNETNPNVDEIINAIILERDATIIIENVFNHAMNLAAIDTTDNEAIKWMKASSDLLSDLNIAFLPFKLSLQKLSDQEFNTLILDPLIAGEKFLLQQTRLLRDQMLSPAEEVILEKMRSPGSRSWMDLYDHTASTLKVEVELNGEKKILSLSQAQAMTKGFDEAEKKAAFLGMQKAWKEIETTPAQALNALADWSYREMEMRSKKVNLHFLDKSLHENRISHQTLLAMMTEIKAVLPQLQKSMIEMAKVLGKEKLDPWDMTCAGPDTKESISFEQAFTWIRDGFAGIDPEFGQFAEMMLAKRWIEARDLNTKGTGGYCMSYPKSRTPRIFQVYRGSYSDIFTVAHELGHAYHSWVMRDLPLRQVYYPATLAETASNFGEFALFDVIQEKLGVNPQVNWLFLERVYSYLINVVARFHFEYEFYEQRKKGILSPQELTDLQVKVWKDWHGDHVTEIETHFWANKGHFYVPGPAFYNYPYTVGFLLSQSIFSLRDKLGDGFWPMYKKLLRDTGVMTCEDLIKNHLGFNIQEPFFWRQGLAELIRKI